MNSSSSIELTTFIKNLTTITIESWFIPFDILMIVCITLTNILATLFSFIIILDKTCHTVPMMLTVNTCLGVLVFGCDMLGLCIFTLQNDFKQTQFQDSLCVFRGYLCYVACALLMYSFLLQAIYRYLTVIYPSRLFCQSFRFQAILICVSWIFSFIYPFVFLFNGKIIYNVNNQICQLALQLSFDLIYMVHCAYIIPILLIMFIYFKLVRYVKGMSKRVAPANTLSRAQRELKMVQRTVILVIILLTFGIPYVLFIFVSFFTTPPKYHFRIAYIFVDVSLIFMMITLFQFTDPLKSSMMKRIKRRSNMVTTTVV
jgi:hypothetical protein